MKFLLWILAVGLLGWPIAAFCSLLFGDYTVGTVVGLVIAGIGAWWLVFAIPAKRRAEKLYDEERAAKKHELAQAERAQRQIAQEAAQRAEKAQRAESARIAAIREITTNAERAADEFGLLPAVLDRASRWEAEAARLFDEKVYSPFWSAIENAFAEVGQFNRVLVSIQASAEKHVALTANCLAVNVSAEDLVAFPIQLHEARATEVSQQLIERLNRLVYEAHKIPEYSAIWEQRRTTAAVIEGFSNLDQAVSYMSSRLHASISNLTTRITEIGHETAIASGAVVEVLSAVNNDLALAGRPMYGAGAESVIKVQSAARRLEAHIS